MAGSSDINRKGSTFLNPFSQTTIYPEPSKKDSMIHHLVENLAAVVAELRKEGVTIVNEIKSYHPGTMSPELVKAHHALEKNW